MIEQTCYVRRDAAHVLVNGKIVRVLYQPKTDTELENERLDLARRAAQLAVTL